MLNFDSIIVRGVRQVNEEGVAIETESVSKLEKVDATLFDSFTLIPILVNITGVMVVRSGVIYIDVNANPAELEVEIVPSRVDERHLNVVIKEK